MTRPPATDSPPRSDRNRAASAALTDWLRRHRTKLLGSLLIGVAFVALLRAGGLPLVPDVEAFRRVKWWTVPAYVGLWTGVHVIRALRWHWLLIPLHRVPARTTLPVAFVGFAAILLLPFRTGEAVRPVLLHRRGGVSGWTAAGTIAAERILDGLGVSLLLLLFLRIGTPLDPLPDRIGDLPVSARVVPAAAYGALAAFLVAFGLLAAFYWRREWARRMTHAIVGAASPALARWVAERVERVAQGLRFLPQPRSLVPFILSTAAYWMLNGAAAWLLAWGCGFDAVGFAEAFVNVGVIALGIVTPCAPGFFGTFQMSSYAGFAMYFPPADIVSAGAAFVFIVYLAQLGITVGFALVSALVGGAGLLDGLTPAPRDSDSAEHQAS